MDELIHKTPESENKIMENDWRIIIIKIIIIIIVIIMKNNNINNKIIMEKHY